MFLIHVCTRTQTEDHMHTYLENGFDFKSHPYGVKTDIKYFQHNVPPSHFQHFSQFLISCCVCQTVVNFISELQEQMCQFQKEINSKIQEKKALESPADSRSPMACPAESTEGQGSNLGVSCDRTSDAMCKQEETPNGPDGNARSLEECSTDGEQQYHSGGESVGAACLHVVYSMGCFSLVCVILQFSLCK